MMLAADLTTYYNRVRRHLDCPKDEQNRLLLGVNKQVIELQADAPNLDYDGIVEFLGEPESLANSLMDDIDPEVILSYQKRKHRLHIARIVSVVALIAVLSTSLYYRVVVIRAPLQGLCYTVRDAVDWFQPPTTRWFQKGSNHSPLQFC